MLPMNYAFASQPGSLGEKQTAATGNEPARLRSKVSHIYSCIQPRAQAARECEHFTCNRSELYFLPSAFGVIDSPSQEMYTIS